MKGDFSKLQFRPADNYTGVRQQQGRVFSDQDGNAADSIARYLRELLGRDAIGSDLVGVPAEDPGALRVLEAESDGTDVRVSVNPGRIWVDGLHLYVPGIEPVTRSATYLGPPITSPSPTPGDITDGTRDALICELWESEFNAFQSPDDLLESALGGPDTTERVVLHHRFRLLRLREGEDCGNLGPRLRDNPRAQGRLTVSATPSTTVVGDCPVLLSGGYTGFEHFLYRIEIAEPDANGARFKYSRFNGGLVGRGTYDGTNKILIRANDQAINLSQLGEFYLEVMARGGSGDPGHWHVRMTADASLVDGSLQLTNVDGFWPGDANDEAFFRLWDGIRPLGDFVANPNELEQGILLTFDPPAGDLGNYRPGDYWAFPVRAAGVDFDPATWPTNAPPQGGHYHRAPLAILNWDDAPTVRLSGAPAIHDCRRVFQPLTRIQTCCRFKVGDGLESFGDFESIQDAVDRLPPEGGEICVLAGTFAENVVIDKDNVRIHGCGPRSRVVSAEPTGGATPVFHVPGRSNIQIENLAVTAHEDGIGILVETDVQGVTPRDIALQRLLLEGARDSAIKVLGGRDVTVRDCNIRMLDQASPWHAIYVQAAGVLIEHNDVQVVAAVSADGTQTEASTGRGGMHVAGRSENVRIIDNLIQGGKGNGITLGSVEEVTTQASVRVAINPIKDIGGIIFDKGDPCGPGGAPVPPPDPATSQPEYQSEGALYDVRIERNRIRDMGLAGIGVLGFFDLVEQDEFISVVGVEILGNEITGCLSRDLFLIPEHLRAYMGYGAIALADVEHLRLYDNVIEDNGADHKYPVCGVFVLHAEGVDVCRNHIVNNGAKSDVDVDDVDPGRRGGIVVVYALPGIVPLTVLQEVRPRQNGEPAARIHDNVVSQPLGQALFLQALGPVSVRGNQLTSRGLIARLQDPSFWAASVWILNLGWSNEFYLQTLGFSGATADPIQPGDLPSAGAGFVPTPRGGLDDFGLGSYMANGNVMFSDNQVLTDLTEAKVSFAISSLLIVSLDDITIQDNQLDCDYLLDFLVTNLIAIGMTVRINNNRFKETIFVTLFSWMALGLLFNNASDNQSTHCFVNLRSPLGQWVTTFKPRVAEHDNHVLYGYFGPPTDNAALQNCAWVSSLLQALMPAGTASASTAPVSTTVPVTTGYNVKSNG